MLFAKGINFNDYPASFKRGTFLRRSRVPRPMTDEELARIPQAHRPAPGALVERSAIVTVDMPSFGSVTNRDAVIFDGAAPETARKKPPATA